MEIPYVEKTNRNKKCVEDYRIPEILLSLSVNHIDFLISKIGTFTFYAQWIHYRFLQTNVTYVSKELEDTGSKDCFAIVIGRQTNKSHFVLTYTPFCIEDVRGKNLARKQNIGKIQN